MLEQRLRLVPASAGTTLRTGQGIMRAYCCQCQGLRLANFLAVYYLKAMVLPKPPSNDRTPHEIAPQESSRAEIDEFLAQMRSSPSAKPAGQGRLIFAMDATMSRRPSWDMALAVQAEMFNAVKAVGGLDVQLVFFRGFDECRASRWVSDAAALCRLMTAVECRGGYTQIRKVLMHALRESAAGKVSALVYVGDAMEENADELCNLAGQLGLLAVPVFLFQEGHSGGARACFKEIARLTHGATCRFGPGSAAQLRELLEAVAVYAAGGRAALQDYAKGRSGPTLLLEQMSKP